MRRKEKAFVAANLSAAMLTTFKHACRSRVFPRDALVWRTDTRLNGPRTTVELSILKALKGWRLEQGLQMDMVAARFWCLGLSLITLLSEEPEAHASGACLLLPVVKSRKSTGFA